MTELSACVRGALDALGVEHLVLGIHDPSFPAAPDEDVGRGTPCSETALRFLGFARALGFDGVQLGPQGRRPPGSASPYDGSLFARDPLSISLGRLASGEGGRLLRGETLAKLVAERPGELGRPAPYAYVEQAYRAALGEAFATFSARLAEGEPGARSLAAELDAFAAREAAWLERSVLYEALAESYAGLPSERWSEAGAPALDARLFGRPAGDDAARARRLEALAPARRARAPYEAFVQHLAHAQHAELRAEASALGLRLFGDCQIGTRDADLWAFRAHFLDDYAMGAPPSRTNPEGQAWHYPVLDPARMGSPARPGPALRLLLLRVEKLLAEYDGLRLDHPHGLVCPWVYRRADADALRAVQQGARLFEAPDLPDHPALARYAIARRDQLNPDPATARHADDWVVSLDDAQVERYAVLVDAFVDAARRRGLPASRLVCEVLSTLPYPLRRVLARHGLGRFRITQKADVRNPADVYRSENARPEDWIMVGNHDTDPLLARIAAWRAEGRLAERARYLADRLAREDERPAFAAALERDPARFADACFADLFASPARHVFVFVADLYGWREPYNRPGTVSDENWSRRLPAAFEDAYRAALARGEGLNLPAALALALRARRGDGFAALAERLAGEGARLRAGA